MNHEPTSGVDAVPLLPDDRTLPPMTERGVEGQLMDAAWPIYGGNSQAAEFWYDFAEGVRLATHYLATPAASPATNETVAQRIEHAEPDEGRQDAGSTPAGFAPPASPSPAPAPETWRDLDDARLQRAIDAFYEPCEGTTIDGLRNAILAWERG